MNYWEILITFFHAHLFPVMNGKPTKRKNACLVVRQIPLTNPEYHYSEKRDGERRQKIASYLENTYR